MISKKEIITSLYLDDIDRFSVTLLEAVSFKNPYAINKAFSQVGAALKLSDIDFKNQVDEQIFYKLDKESKKLVLAFADTYDKLRKGLSLNASAVDNAVKNKDMNALQNEYSKALSESVSRQILHKITPSLKKLFNTEPQISTIKKYLYGLIAVKDTSNWQEFLVSQFGSSEYDSLKLNGLYEGFLSEYYAGEKLINRDERVDNYKKFLKENNSYAFVDKRVQKYAEELLKKYREEFGCDLSQPVLDDFAKENSDLIVRNFSSLINFVDDKVVRFNFVSPVLERLTEYAKAHSQDTQEDPSKPFQELLEELTRDAIDNTPMVADKPAFESLLEHAQKKTDLKVKPFILKKANVKFGDSDVLQYVEEQVESVSTEPYLDWLDKKFVARNKRKLISILVDSDYSDEVALNQINKISNIDKSL